LIFVISDINGVASKYFKFYETVQDAIDGGVQVVNLAPPVVDPQENTLYTENGLEYYIWSPLFSGDGYRIFGETEDTRWIDTGVEFGSIPPNTPQETIFSNDTVSIVISKGLPYQGKMTTISQVDTILMLISSIRGEMGAIVNVNSALEGATLVAKINDLYLKHLAEIARLDGEVVRLDGRIDDERTYADDTFLKKAFEEYFEITSIIQANDDLTIALRDKNDGTNHYITKDNLEKTLYVLADKVVEGDDRKFVTALQKTWLNEYNGANGFLKAVNGVIDLSAIPITEFEFEGRLTSVNTDDTQSVQGNKVTQVVGNRTDATLNTHEIRANSAKLKTAIGGEYTPTTDDSLVHKKYVDTRDQIILADAKADSTDKVVAHNLDNTSHPFLTNKVEGLEREVERIDSRGRAYGEIPYLTTVLQGFTVSQRNTTIVQAIRDLPFNPNDYTPQNGDLVYDEGTGNGVGFHEWEFNGTNWVDNGVIGFAKATNSIFGQIKGDPTKIDILNGQVIKIIADEAVRDQHGNIIDDHYATLADLEFIKTAWGWKSENFGTIDPSTNVRFTQDELNPLTKYLDQYDFIHVRILQPTPTRSFDYLGDTPIAYNQSFTVSSLEELDNPENYLDPFTVSIGWVIRLLRIENEEPFYKFYEVVGSDGEGTVLHSLAFLPKDIRNYTDGRINLVSTTTYLQRDGVNAQFITNISDAVFKVEGYSVNPIDSSKIDHKGEPLDTFLDGVEEELQEHDERLIQQEKYTPQRYLGTTSGETLEQLKN
jgi:hypothetical protein